MHGDRIVAHPCPVSSWAALPSCQLLFSARRHGWCMLRSAGDLAGRADATPLPLPRHPMRAAPPEGRKKAAAAGPPSAEGKGRTEAAPPAPGTEAALPAVAPVPAASTPGRGSSGPAAAPSDRATPPAVEEEGQGDAGSTAVAKNSPAVPANSKLPPPSQQPPALPGSQPRHAEPPARPAETGNGEEGEDGDAAGLPPPPRKDEGASEQDSQPPPRTAASPPPPPPSDHHQEEEEQQQQQKQEQEQRGDEQQGDEQQGDEQQGGDKADEQGSRCVGGVQAGKVLGCMPTQGWSGGWSKALGRPLPRACSLPRAQEGSQAAGPGCHCPTPLAHPAP